MTTQFFCRTELTESEIVALRKLLESEDWHIIMKVADTLIENMRRSLEYAEGNALYKLQGAIGAVRSLQDSLKAACAPPNEQQAEREYYEQIRRTTGRDAGGGY